MLTAGMAERRHIWTSLLRRTAIVVGVSSKLLNSQTTKRPNDQPPKRLILMYQQREQEAHDEDGGGAEHDGKILMQVDAGEVVESRQGNPCDDGDACHTADEGSPPTDATGENAQQEEAEHTAREDGRQFPPRIDDALHTEHGNGDDNADNADDATRQTEHHHVAALRGAFDQRLVVVGEDDGGGGGDTGGHRAHAGGEDGGDEQTAQTHRETVDDEEREHVVGLGGNVIRQQTRMRRVVAVECRTDEEKQRGDGDEQVTAKQGGEACVAVGLRCMIALHVVLVDAIVLKVDEDAVDEAYPERRRGEVGGERSQ